MPVLVRNTTTGPTVFSDPPNNIAIEWAGKDDPQGGDVQHVPDALVTENTQFLKAIQNGILEVVQASEETEEKLRRQVAAYREKTAQTAQIGQDALDPSDEQPLVQAHVAEDGKVAYSEEEPSVPVVTDEVKDGVAQEDTIPVVMGPRERE